MERKIVFLVPEGKWNHRMNLHGVTLWQLHWHYGTERLTVCIKQGIYPKRFWEILFGEGGHRNTDWSPPSKPFYPAVSRRIRDC